MDGLTCVGAGANEDMLATDTGLGQSTLVFFVIRGAEMVNIYCTVHPTSCLCMRPTVGSVRYKQAQLSLGMHRQIFYR